MIDVMSREMAIQYCMSPHSKEAVMISISDPRMEYCAEPFISETNKVKDILRLCFSDADQPGPDVYGNPVGINDLMTDDDARRIVGFVCKYQDIDIIVHCDAGISRSAGVAAAILKLLTGSDFQIFDCPYYHPNMWCYRKVINTGLMIIV